MSNYIKIIQLEYQDFKKTELQPTTKPKYMLLKKDSILNIKKNKHWKWKNEKI